MKLAFILLGVFFFLVTMRVQSRELTEQEKLALIPWENTRVVRNFMAEETKLSNLGWVDRLGFGALTKTCEPLVKHIQKIEGEIPDYPEQSKTLIQLYALCSEGTMGLSRLYIKSISNQ